MGSGGDANDSGANGGLADAVACQPVQPLAKQAWKRVATLVVGASAHDASATGTLPPLHEPPSPPLLATVVPASSAPAA